MLKIESRRTSLSRIEFSHLLLVCVDKMDIQTLISKLREEVSCPVCSEVFTDPKHLSCLHSFCLKCLKGWYESCGGGNDIRCPKCQTLCRVPASGDLQDLPTSFYLNGMMDVLNIKECYNTKVTCGNCDEKSSEASYCFECYMFYCKECVAAHNIMHRRDKSHRVLAVKEFQDKDYEDVLKRPAFCSKQRHEKKHLEFYCKNCETAVCQTCINLEHSGHAFSHIEDEAERQKTELKIIVERQRNNLEAKKNVIQELDENRTRVIQQSENTKKNVQRFADKLNAIIEAEKENIFAAVENQTQTSLDILTTKASKIEHEIREMELSLEQADKVLIRSTDIEIVQNKASLQKRFKDLFQTELIVRDPEGLPVLAFQENRKLFDTVNSEDIGHLETPHRTKASQPLADRKGFSSSPIASRYVSSEQGASSQAMSVYLFQFKPVFSFGQKGSSVGKFDCPWGVAVSDRDEIAVIDFWNSRVQIFDSSGNYLRSFGRKGTGQGEFMNPGGICFDKNRNIFVADRDNHRIQIFSGEGEYIGMFGGEGIRDNQLDEPSGLSLDSNGNIMVADAGNKVIKVFSPKGKFLMKIGEQGSFSYPIHCIMSYEYFIVSDHREHCIKYFDREGNFQFKFGKQGSGDGEFKFPYCLSMSKSGHLLVCDAYNHRIQVFELNGKFVNVFGTKGSNLGEFSSPKCVAVLSNGRIAVSEFQNHRIQIFE